MTARRTGALATLLVVGGLAAGGCGTGVGTSAATAAPAATEQPATLQDGKDGAPGIVHLSPVAQQRLDIRTSTVGTAGGVLVMPYGAVVYEPDGSSWAFVQTEERTYQREPLTITGISGDQVTLGSGPPVGTPVVTQGAAELVGVETGIDGEQ
jgi:hypothetical protein